MKCLLLICVGFIVVAQSFAMNVSHEWENYKTKFNKFYREKEEDRRKIFEANLKMVQEHNNGNHSYILGINHLSDLTLDEYKSLILADLKDLNPNNETLTFYNPTKSISLPSEVDWRTKGYVTRVKNQGQCGSCWAFSATGSLEGQHFNMTNQLVSLSEQNLVDCSGPYGNIGCDGGFPNNAFEYVIKNGGIDTEASYPYTAKNGECKYSASFIGARCSGYTNIRRGSESDLQYATAKIGPISVCINAGSQEFQNYKSGVFNQPNCGNSRNELDHCVLVVGYGTTIDGTKYWLVKNSWGPGWGSEGYIKMSRNEDNQCGIATLASFPLVPHLPATAAEPSGCLKLQSCLVTVMVFLFGLFNVLQ